MFKYNNKVVSSVVLGQDAVQPSGATGDNRVIAILFVDGSIAENTTIAALKAESADYNEQLTVNFPAQVARVTEKKTNVDGIIGLTTTL